MIETENITSIVKDDHLHAAWGHTDRWTTQIGSAESLTFHARPPQKSWWCMYVWNRHLHTKKNDFFISSWKFKIIEISGKDLTKRQTIFFCRKLHMTLNVTSKKKIIYSRLKMKIIKSVGMQKINCWIKSPWFQGWSKNPTVDQEIEKYKKERNYQQKKSLSYNDQFDFNFF